LTSAEKSGLPTSSFQSARGFHLSPRAARAAFSKAVIASEAKQSISPRKGSNPYRREKEAIHIAAKRKNGLLRSQ
jgi:hypothetical protein